MDTLLQVNPTEMEIQMNVATVSMRNYFSSYHLWSAENNSKKAKEIEDAHVGKPRFDIEHRAYVIGAVISSVAFVEAVINELFQDIKDGHSSYLTGMEKKTANLVSSIWDDIDRVNILKKFQLGLFCFRKDLFNTGASPYQDMDLVIKIRNDLVHYKPKSLCVNSTHTLESKLKGKFQENKLMSGAGNNCYPDKYFGCGCSNWATQSAKKFADDFFAKIEITPNYQQVKWDK